MQARCEALLQVADHLAGRLDGARELLAELGDRNVLELLQRRGERVAHALEQLVVDVVVDEIVRGLESVADRGADLVDP